MNNSSCRAVFYACVVLAMWAASARAQSETKPVDEPAPIKLEELGKKTPLPKSPETQQPATPKIPKLPNKPWSIADEKVDLRLLRDRVVPVTPPKNAKLRRKVRREPLPVEGTAVVNRAGGVALDLESGWMVMKFENQPGQTWVVPHRLLQNSLLEKVEAILAKNPNTRFEVVGETTIYQGKAYLLFQRVAVVDSPPPPKPAPDKTAPKPLVQPEKVTLSQAESQPAKDAAPEKKGNDPTRTTSKLIEALMKDSPRKALRVAPDPDRSAKENLESVAPAGHEPLNPGRKGLVIDRLVRLVKKDHWWEVHFESDNTLREPPMRVLPNQQLAKAVQMNSQLGQGALKLRVSGVITFYKGRRYLLIRKILRQRDMDQF